ncbi:MAG: DUF3999 domain-containing protein, partial [Verrucomicrobia bacterium]|nr:DUF3999 domain-containing protein [Verrucomicrobiota bacterium]
MNRHLNQDRARHTDRAADPKAPRRFDCRQRRSIALLIFLGALRMSAAPFSEWQYQQDIAVTGGGLVKVSLPAETLDAARPGLEDLRLVDAAGNEVPYLIERPMPAAPTVLPAKSFRTSLADRTTILLIETGLDESVTGVSLETPERQFIKAVRVEGSADGKRWSLIAGGIPVFRQAGGASGLRVEFAAGRWPWLRLSLDDARTDPVPFTGARVHAAALETPPSLPVPVDIVAREEGVGETRLNLALPAANLTLASLEVETDEPLFTRRVTLATPEVSDDGAREQAVASGTLLRFGGNGQPALVRRALAVDRQIPSRELVLQIRNEDSPPLAITGVRALRRPVYLVFFAREAGEYRLFAGNPLCEPARYDIAALSNPLRTQSGGVTEAFAGGLSENPGFQAPEALPGLSPVGAVLDVAPWKYRKPVAIEHAGVQTLELDLEVVAGAQRGFGDLRLVQGGRQVPFLIEHTSRLRIIQPDATVMADLKPPTISRWSIPLPLANLPVNRLVCESPSPLFERRVRLFEEVVDIRGARRARELGSASWSRTPDAPARPLELPLTQAPQSEALYLETDNGDNPPIELKRFQVLLPVTRMVFKAPAGDTPILYYGNPAADAPHYDLKLVGRQLLAAPRVAATPGQQQELKAASWTEGPPLTGMRGVLFWGVLGLVVAGLLIILARLLPKSKPAG